MGILQTILFLTLSVQSDHLKTSMLQLALFREFENLPCPSIKILKNNIQNNIIKMYQYYQPHNRNEVKELGSPTCAQCKPSETLY